MFKDLTNEVFNNLKVIKYIGKNNKGKSLWECRCLLCGNITNAITSELKRGHKKSCGCLRLIEVKKSISTHNHSYTRLYTIWTDMKQRCFNQNSKPFKNYGGRGITICDEWKNNFQAFYNWSVTHGYADDLTIDRKDNDGDYCPENCRWITFVEQQNNRSNNTYLTWNNETNTISDWSRILDIPCYVISSRLHKLKWSVEKTLSTPIKKRKEVTK